MKDCRSCYRSKPDSDFSRNNRNADGLNHACRDCVSRRRATYAVPGAGVNRKRALSKRYGLTPEQYDDMVSDQDGACAICGGPPDRAFHGRPPQLAIDHCHDTNKVRGLLCFGCNVRLGAVEDKTFLAAALAYLEKTT